MQGKVTYWSDSGYGFIRDDLGKDHFFHQVETDAVFTVGQRVSFSLGQGSKGRSKAVRVRKV